MKKSVKKTKSKSPKGEKQYHGGLESMTYRATKRLAVSLGMPFPDACAAGFPELQGFIQRTNEREDPSLISQYDEWMDAQLAARGYPPEDPMRHYQLRLSYISEDSMAKAPKMGLKPKKDKKEVKPKREKDESGLWKGTKKSYTFELAKRGYTLDRVTRRVLKKFPDANESSIKQWWKRAIKETAGTDSK